MSQDYIAGQRLGDYEVLAVLGAGGMGKVYKVRNLISDRIEAMKIILPSLANQKDLADRFQREIKLLGSLDHPNIAALRTALTINDQLVMIMEYVDGVTLASRLQQGAIPVPDAVNYADQVLSALSYAHKLKVIHRDIKPANMMLTPQGVVKLMDFGLARPTEQALAMTATSTTVGSISYMPPEQVKGEAVDARSDLYSLGVSLYEIVTGQLPFQGDSGYSLMAAHVQELPKAPIEIRPDLPKTLNEIILIALAKDPAKRFQSADAFRNALKNVVVVPAPMPAAKVAAVSATVASPAYAADTPSRAPTAVAHQPVSQPHIEPTVAAASASHPGSLPTNNYRGFYMALGALLVVCVLVAAGFYLPRKIKTHASPRPAAATSPVAAPAVTSEPQPERAPASSPVAAPSASEPSAILPASADSPAPASAATRNLPNNLSSPSSKSAPRPSEPKPKASTSSNRVSAPRPPAVTASAPAAALTPNPSQQASVQSNAQQAAAAAAAELDQTQHEADQLNSRALAVSQGLDGLRRAQSAQGYGLRGDIVASEQRMRTNLSAAQSALDKQDAAVAKKYLNLAAVEVERIEKFLGR